MGTMAVPANSVAILFLLGGSTSVAEPEYSLVHTICLRAFMKLQCRSCRLSHLMYNQNQKVMCQRFPHKIRKL